MVNRWNDRNRRGDGARGIVCLAALAALAVLVGCDDSGRVGVSGRVTFLGGAPIDHGVIEFTPSPTSRIAGAGSPIVDGQYLIPRAKGLLPGNYLVRIYAPTLVKAESGAPGALGLAPPRERVASHYNLESKLTMEVSGTEDLERDFAIERSDAKK